MSEKKLRRKMSPCVPLRFPDFEKQYEYEQKIGIGETLAYNFNPVDCRDWYRTFADRMITAVDESNYLPLYRMGDGEYLFALRKDSHDSSSIWEGSLRQTAMNFVSKLLGEAQRGSGGIYTHTERRKAYSKFVEGVKMVADEGILGLGLHDTPLYNRYIPEILDWFDEKDVSITTQNYIHVYGIHVLLNGSYSDSLIGGKNVLAVTWLNSERKKKIKKGLSEKGANDVHFAEVSKRKSMLDDINIYDTNKLDIVLIAAGIGTINVLKQLKKMRVPQIDIGYCMDVIANPELRWERPYLVPDSEFDPDRVRYH
jgi:hypothetical protein